MTTKKNLFSNDEKKAILWNIVNSFLAGGLVLVGALSSGVITKESLLIGIIVSVGVIFTNFKDYWLNIEPSRKGVIRFI